MKKILTAAVIAALLLCGCSSTDEDESMFLPGVIDENGVYKNTSINLSFTLPERWSYASDEELNEMTVNQGEEDVILCDMAAYSDDYTTSIILRIENTSDYSGGEAVTEDIYLDALEENFSEVTGYSCEIVGRYTAALGESDYTLLRALITDYGMYQDYAVRLEGSYMVCIIVTSFEETPALSVAEFFS